MQQFYVTEFSCESLELYPILLPWMLGFFFPFCFYFEITGTIQPTKAVITQQEPGTGTMQPPVRQWGNKGNLFLSLPVLLKRGSAWMNLPGSHQQFLIPSEQSSISVSSGLVDPQLVVAAEEAQHANVLANLKPLCCRIKHDKTTVKREAIIPNERRRIAEIGLSGRDKRGRRSRHDNTRYSVHILPHPQWAHTYHHEKGKRQHFQVSRPSRKNTHKRIQNKLAAGKTSAPWGWRNLTYKRHRPCDRKANALNIKTVISYWINVLLPRVHQWVEEQKHWFRME